MNSEKSEIKKDFWKSLKEYYNDPEVLKNKVNEFADGVTDDFNPDDLNTVSRRRFIALLSASAAFAATACSDYRDKGEIIPYTQRPEGLLPGKANYYASFVNNKSVLVKVREGRPILIEGNPDHPIFNGKVDAQTPAAILILYDPERLKEPHKSKRTVTWKNADSEIIEALNKAVADKKEIAIISNRVDSPTQKKLIEDFTAKYPTAKWYSYEQLSDENKRIAWEKCYGTRNIPSVKLADAQIILALESDFLGREGNTVENIRLFSQRRDVMKGTDFNRLYSVEGAMSLTGMNSDYRLRLKSDAQLEFVLSLLNELVMNKNISSELVDSTVSEMLKNHSLRQFVSKYGMDSAKISYLVDDLMKYRNRSIVIAGESLPVDVQVAVNLLNEILGNTEMYNYDSVIVDHHNLSSADEFKNLVTAIDKGEVGLVVNFDANPVYHLPDDLLFADALKKVSMSVSIVESENETSALSTYTLPASNELESWGDNYNRSDVYELRQPVISPIFNTRQKENIILTWINGSPEAYSDEAIHNYLMDNFKAAVYDVNNVPVEFTSYWFNSLHDGFVKLKSKKSEHGKFINDSVKGISVNPVSDSYSVLLSKSYFVGDGRFTNNGWLQEIPHPVSKVAWDNYAAVSPSTAKELNVKNEDLINIKTENGSLEIPIMIQPGMADKLINIELGYGRTVIGDVGLNSGFDAGSLNNSSNMNCGIIKNVTVNKTTGTYKLATTQEHHSLDDQSVKDFHKIRKIIQGGTLAEYIKEPEFLKGEGHTPKGITREHKYEGVKWGMSIDMNKCISCATCVASCNVENNIPVVGKDQVARGREMHWMRIDRYYSGTPDEPEASGQPMLCQHCDNAPCENVCPVNATNHSPDGLNQMAYNRCVGTRYCANNCPFKVRRFNFYNFRDNFADAYYNNELTYLANNPEVTVRSRGVMEKCTFCVQRIMEAREEAIREGKPLKGTDVVTACQSACPADAIVFGDTNEKDSIISKYREHELGYHVLEELYIKPNVTYIAKLKNTHSEDI